MTKSEKLAELLLSDRERPKVYHNIIPCWSCGHTFVYRGRQGELNGNFCSMRCQSWHDAGNPSFERQRELTKIAYRCRISCAHCTKEFESKGLRCCSVECERGLKERADNLAVMAEAGIDAAPKKRCAAPDCDAVIPKWKNGRRALEDRLCTVRLMELLGLEIALTTPPLTISCRAMHIQGITTEDLAR
jgi:hypothetical protein